MEKTLDHYEKIFSTCLNIFSNKFDDYGSSWRVLRLPSITDQIYIKAQRIRNLQENKEKKINESEDVEFIGCVNYCLIAIIQLDLGVSDIPDISKEKAIKLFKEKFEEAKKLMLDKNHDYGEAWKSMRVSSITDIILQKILRLRSIEDNNGITKVSEGVEANYMDIINYSIFSLIKLKL